MGASIKEVIVTENFEQFSEAEKATQQQQTSAASASAALSAVRLSASIKGQLSDESRTLKGDRESGRLRLSVNIGTISRAITKICDRLDSRLWILVDEWSVLSEDIQPYLADFIKRVLYPNPRCTVHIAAIEYRSRFRIGEGANSIGIELGSDAFADVDLDDYLLVENDPERSRAFFKEMIYKHVVEADRSASEHFTSSDEFVKIAFTYDTALKELIRACEGVPRDAINILQLAATRAGAGKIAVPHIRVAAGDWYERDKTAYINSTPAAGQLLQKIIADVIGGRKARAFLVRAETRNEIIERLFDERLLHIAKRSYSTKEEPGIRFRVWKIDYGCYVKLINTSAQPTGFLFPELEFDGDFSQAVPEDDYRAIRRAILEI